MTSLHAEEVFLSHYQFSHDPFAARVPGFKFFPAQRKPVLGQLHHLARYSQLLLLVSGPLGSGKTLLRQALVASTNKQNVLPVVVSASEAGSAASLLLQISQVLGLPAADAAAIRAHVEQCALTGQEVYLLVDDAERLDSEALAELLALAQERREGRAHVFLFGEPDTAERLQALSEEGDEERFHTIELQPYTEEETAEYLAQRLEGAGQSLAVFSAEQLAEIQERSGGWPGAINEVAYEILIEDMQTERGLLRPPGFTFNLPRQQQLGLLGILLVVLVGWLLLGGDDAEQAPTTAPLADNRQPAPPRTVSATSSQALPLPRPSRSDIEAQPNAVVADAPAPDEQTWTIDPAPQASATTALPLPSIPAEAIAPAPAPVTAPAPAPVAKPAPTPAPAPAPTVAKTTPLPLPSTVATELDSDWYLAQNGKQYALQVLALSTEAAARDFVRAQGSQYRYYRKLHQGKPLYVVTMGTFPSQAAARAAIANLPATVREAKPWARPFAGIQQEIAQSR